jgi:hypothetical protein
MIEFFKDANGKLLGRHLECENAYMVERNKK